MANATCSNIIKFNAIPCCNPNLDHFNSKVLRMVHAIRDYHDNRKTLLNIQPLTYYGQKYKL